MFDLIKAIITEFDVDCEITSNKQKTVFTAKFVNNSTLGEFSLVNTYNGYEITLNKSQYEILKDKYSPIYNNKTSCSNAQDVLARLRYLRATINEQNKVV